MYSWLGSEGERVSAQEAGENRSEIFIEVWLAPLPSGSTCMLKIAAGFPEQQVRFRGLHIIETHNMSMREREIERDAGRGREESAHGGRFEPWSYRFVFSLYFIWLLFLTDTFPVYFLPFRSKTACAILNLTATCIHIKLHLGLEFWFLSCEATNISDFVFMPKQWIWDVSLQRKPESRFRSRDWEIYWRSKFR